VAIYRSPPRGDGLTFLLHIITLSHYYHKTVRIICTKIRILESLRLRAGLTSTYAQKQATNQLYQKHPFYSLFGGQRTCSYRVHFHSSSPSLSSVESSTEPCARQRQCQMLPPLLPNLFRRHQWQPDTDVPQ